MSKRKTSFSGNFLENEAMGCQGLYFSHKSGRFFEVKLAKRKVLGFPTVKMKMEDGEVRNVPFFHISLVLHTGTYEQIIPFEDLV